MDEQENTTQETGQDAQETAAGAQGQQGADSGAEKMNAFQRFISGLFSAGKDAGSEEASKDETEDAAGGTGENRDKTKGYTQADLDSAISAARKQWEDEAAEAERRRKMSPEERTAEDQKKKDARIADLEGQLLKKELREEAVKALEKDGYSPGLAEMLDYSSRERMEETLKATEQIFKDSLAGAVQARLKGKTPEGLGRAASAENMLRDQIARNIRGI